MNEYPWLDISPTILLFIVCIFLNLSHLKMKSKKNHVKKLKYFFNLIK